MAFNLFSISRLLIMKAVNLPNGYIANTSFASFLSGLGNTSTSELPH
jgi:hypothetical protein